MIEFCLLFGIWLAAGCLLGRARCRLAATSLRLAWRWSVVVWLVWLAALGTGFSGLAISTAHQEAAWYLAGVMALTPPMAVLGARRPTVNVWSWFVLLPLTIVFAFPLLITDFSRGHLLVSAPLSLGLLLVLLMGTGNYMGTRYSASALLYAAAVALAVLPVLEWSRDQPWHVMQLSTWAVLPMALALGFGWRAARRTVVASRFDRVWNEFRESFGIVWGRRIQDRINARAVDERWPVRLGDTGFIPLATDTGHDLARPTDRWTGDVDTRIEHALRWHLRRFVDGAWLDARLDTGEETPTVPPP